SPRQLGGEDRVREDREEDPADRRGEREVERDVPAPERLARGARAERERPREERAEEDREREAAEPPDEGAQPERPVRAGHPEDALVGPESRREHVLRV